MTVLQSAKATVLDQLPAWTADAKLTAIIDRGDRVLCWTLPEPGGQLYRNAYRMAWIELREQDFMLGRLYVSATRVMPVGSWSRDSFTDGARQRLSADLVPLFAENVGSFHQLWTSVHRFNHADTSAVDALAETQRTARWWRSKRDLDRAWADGFLDLSPCDDEGRPYYQRPEVRVAPGYRGGNWPRAHVVARLMRWCDCLACQAGDELDSHQVGWLTDSGDVIPLAGILDPPKEDDDG